jgi:flagellar hook-associated protein 2
MPITQLQNQQSLLTEQQQAYQSLQGKVADVDTAVQGLISAMGTSSYSANNSSPTVATASITTGALEGTYTLNVLNAGSFTLAMSNSGLTTVTDPTIQNIAAGTSFTLSVNGNNTTINLTTASLNAMATAINQANAGVEATVIDIGSPSAPDYRLSLVSTATQNVPISLTDSGGNPLVTVETPGSEASYQVNGQPPGGISSTSQNVTIASGVQATIQAAGSTTITVGRDSTALSSALNTLVTAYNDAMTELDQYHGQNGGVLEGQSEVFSLESSLRSLIDYTGGSGTVTSLTSLGLSYSDNGQLSFDPSALNSISMSDADSFFGDGTSNGYLLNAENILNSIDDPNTGTLTAAVNSVSSQIQDTQNQISAAQDRVNVLQENLTTQMANADSTIAELEQQSTYFTDLFEAMKMDSQSITNG